MAAMIFSLVHVSYVKQSIVNLNKNKKSVPLRAMKTFIRKKMDHTT